MGRVDSGIAAMNVIAAIFAGKARLRALFRHCAVIKDPREPWRVAHPLPEMLLRVDLRHSDGWELCGKVGDGSNREGGISWGC